MTTPMKPPAPPSAPPQRKLQFGSISKAAGHRAILYGPGGVGKTTLATLAPGPVAFFDFDDSLSRLLPQLEREPMLVSGDNWQDLRLGLQSDGWQEIKTIVIDSITRAEELCIAHTLATVPHEKGHRVSKLEDYGYGKGYQHVFDTFLALLGDLDRHCHVAGRNVILIAHDCVTNVPNPAGEDWLRYEPRLQSPASGKASIRLRVREWADHVLFFGYDVVAKDGKGKGSGTRTLWPAELPHCMAKSRTTQDPIAVDRGVDVWAHIFK